MSVLVGVLDSGVGAAFAANVRAGRSFAAGDAPARPGHGSVIAGIVLHHAPGTLLLDARVFGERRPTTPAMVAAGLDWLCEQGARIVNMSLGLRQDRQVLRDAVARAVAEGVILVASVPARGVVPHPGAYPGVIRVSGDARCGLGEISALGGTPADYGATPCAPDGRPGGASLAAAHVTGLLARHLADGEGEPRALLDRIARFRGRERRLA